MLNLVIDYHSNNMKHKVRIKDCVKVWALSKNISVIVLIIYTGGGSGFSGTLPRPVSKQAYFRQGRLGQLLELFQAGWGI